MQGTDLLSWMAWTWPTAAFFAFILVCLVVMTAWERVSRHGILGLDTTRGDRLFIWLLGSAYIFLAWLGLMGEETLWAPLAVAIAYGLAVFLWV
jgi:predicted small integral membrane protein